MMERVRRCDRLVRWAMRSLSTTSASETLQKWNLDLHWTNIPNKVKIVEVGPRDGLQNESQPVRHTRIEDHAPI